MPSWFIDASKAYFILVSINKSRGRKLFDVSQWREWLARFKSGLAYTAGLLRQKVAQEQKKNSEGEPSDQIRRSARGLLRSQLAAQKGVGIQEE
ncbi:hypothetical protein [Bradyrhizobium sp. USDA 4448]